ELGSLHHRCNDANYAGGDAVLQLEHIREVAVKPIGPKVHPIRGIDKLASDPYSNSGFSHASFEYITHAKFTASLPNIWRAALIDKARIAGDHKQRFERRQGSDDVLDQSINEVFLLRVPTHVLEREHSDGRFVG